MKILFLGDASNYHHTLANALAKMGHEVTVASHGSYWMNTRRDIDISRPCSGKLGGALLWAKFNTILRNNLKGYDVVHISNPTFLDLRPHRNREIFDRLKRNNGRVFLTALGTDSHFVEMCCATDSPLRYSEWQIDGKPGPIIDKKAKWLNLELYDHCRYIYDNIDGVVTALYEYDLSARRILTNDMVAYGGIPIDTKAITPQYIDNTPEIITLFLGRHRNRQAEKGTDHIENVAKRIVEKYPTQCQLDIVENLPYNEYLARLRKAHIVMDQLYSFTPATNALLAMAMGLNTLSGGEEDFYRFINENELRPIINAIPNDDALYKTLEEVILHPEIIVKRSKEGRKFVEKHNDSKIVAQRFIDFWQTKM
ncbi:MAG: hypothetical protein IKV32_00635 [Muribaculaceae bacterium]|nr:hypothetical protein [Muribaculaceae bacterium]